MTGRSKLEARLHSAQINRVIILWLLAWLCVLVGWLFWDSRSDAVEACERGTRTAKNQAELATMLRAWEIRDEALQRVRLDCGEAFSVLP